MNTPAPLPLPAPLTDLRWSGLTDRGKVRPNNEDSFLALAFDGREVRRLGKIGTASSATSDFVFAVSDGMGGAKSGEFASRITVEKITQLLPKSFKLSASGMSSGFTDILLEVFHAIHYELLKFGYSYEECLGMGTTLTLGWLTPGWLYFGHIGDSRLYYLPQSGGITQLTHDHTHVGYLRRQGQINEREARAHPMRNALHQALGAGHQFIEPQFGAVALTPGDRFVLCSDGLVDGLGNATSRNSSARPRRPRKNALPPNASSPPPLKIPAKITPPPSPSNSSSQPRPPPPAPKILNAPQRRDDHDAFRLRHPQTRRLQPPPPRWPNPPRPRPHRAGLHALFSRRLSRSRRRAHRRPRRHRRTLVG